MKIAAPVTLSNEIDSHFGHCSFYNVYTIVNQRIEHLEKMDSPEGCGCKSNIASVLATKGVSLMLAGGIGEGAIQVLNQSGIDVIRGCSGNATDVVNLYLAGSVQDSGSSCQLHNEHGDHEHTCQH